MENHWKATEPHLLFIEETWSSEKEGHFQGYTVSEGCLDLALHLLTHSMVCFKFLALSGAMRLCEQSSGSFCLAARPSVYTVTVVYKTEWCCGAAAVGSCADAIGTGQMCRQPAALTGQASHLCHWDPPDPRHQLPSQGRLATYATEIHPIQGYGYSEHF